MRIVTKDEALARLEDFRRTLPPHTCLPCALVAHTSDAERLAENEHAVVLINRFAQRRGHLMVWLKRHVEHVHQLDWTAYQAMHRLGYDAARALHAAFAPPRVYSAVVGSTADLPNSYAHLHVHVIPVFERDERARPASVFTWGEGVVTYEREEAAALAQMLRDHWPAD